MPNCAIIHSSHTALLQNKDLPLKAREAHIFPGLENRALLSIGTFCDNGCIAQFDETKAIITEQQSNKIIMQGGRDQITTLYMIEFEQNSEMTEPQIPDKLFANNVYECISKQDLAVYYHQTCWSPSPSTWIAAIQKGFFATWPGLTADLVRKYLPKSEYTTKVHMKQRFKNIRSTKTSPSPIKHETTCSANDDIAKDNNIDSTSGTNKVFVKLTEIEGKINTDQTGRFAVTSSRGNKYIMVAYDYDSNTIHAEAMKSRTGGEPKAAYKKIQTLLASRGLKPNVHFLDNECADTFKQLMTEAGEEYQLVPPHVHRKNAAERALQTLKNHLIVGLSSTHNDFPLHLWCRMLPQGAHHPYPSSFITHKSETVRVCTAARSV